MDTVRKLLKLLMGRIQVFIPRLQVFIPRISRVGGGGGGQTFGSLFSVLMNEDLFLIMLLSA